MSLVVLSLHSLGVCAALGTRSGAEVVDGTALIQTHVNPEFVGFPMPDYVDANSGSLVRLEARHHAEMEARVHAAMRALKHGPGATEEDEPKGEVVRPILTLAELHRSFMPVSEGDGAPKQSSSLLLLKASVQSKAASAPDWKLRADGNDTSDPGTIFRFTPGVRGGVSLRTEYGMWLVLDHGKLTASSLDREKAGANASFLFQEHPYREMGEGRIVSWRTANGTYIGVGSQGDLVEVAAVPGDQATKFRMARLGGDRLVLQSVHGMVVADKHRAISDAYFSWANNYPFIVRRLEVAAADFIQKFGWHRGWMVGCIVGAVFCLTAYSIVFSLSDTEEEKRGRLAGFDIVRFFLEYLVIYSHLASVLGLADWGISQWLTAYKMPSFVFITGMFGSSMTYESVTRMLCYTVGTSVMLLVLRLIEIQAIWGSDQLSQQVGTHFDFDNFAPGLWFLVNLWIWRIAVSPLFWLARKTERREAAVAVSFLVLYVVCFLILGWTGGWDAWIYGNYNWRHLLFYAPFFAAGLLRSPADWSAAFSRRRTQAVSALFFVAFHVLTAISGFKHWNRYVSCFPPNSDGCHIHQYPLAIYAGVTSTAFFYDLLMFALRLGLAMSTVCLLSAAASSLETHLPNAASLAAGWGSRTLYAYIIHIHLLNNLDKDGYMKNATGLWADGSKFAVAIIVSGIVLVSFSSRGVERWFHWVLKPYWIKDWLEWLVQGCPASARKAKGTDVGQSPSQLLEQAEGGPAEQAGREEHAEGRAEGPAASAVEAPAMPAQPPAAEEPAGGPPPPAAEEEAGARPPQGAAAEAPARA